MENNLVRRLEWEACYNIRELGGYETQNGKSTRWGAFLRADNLSRLSQKGQASLIAYGVRTVIDLRNADELLITPNPFAGKKTLNGSVQYYNVPIIAEENEEALNALKRASSNRDSYCLILDHFSERFVIVLRLIAKARAGGIVFHCHAGKDRTGLTAMLLLRLAGVSREVITADYTLSNQYLDPLFDELMIYAPADPGEREAFRLGLYAQDQFIQGAMDFIDHKYGGVESYLEQSGLTSQEIMTIQNRLVQPVENE